MKTLFFLMSLLLSLALFTACAPKGGTEQKASSQPAAADPAAALPGLPDAPTPAPVATPSPTPAPTATPAAPTPTPAPSNLSCFSNGGVFCTGGNLGSSMVQLDLALMFTGNNPNDHVQSATVANDVNATFTGVICSQPTCANSFLHSSCVTAHITVTASTPFNFTLCGNAVNTTNNTLEEL